FLVHEDGRAPKFWDTPLGVAALKRRFAGLGSIVGGHFSRQWEIVLNIAYRVWDLPTTGLPFFLCFRHARRRTCFLSDLLQPTSMIKLGFVSRKIYSKWF